MKYLKPRVVFAAITPMLLTLLASGPPPEGVETQLYVGTGSFEYQSGGCGSPTYANRAVDGHGFASTSYRHETGATAVVEVGGGVAKTTSSRLLSTETDPSVPPTDVDEVGKTRGMVNVAARVGFHHSYFGLELGPAYNTDLGFFPSGEVWVGVPRYVFAYVDVASGPVSLGHLPVGAGLGHASDRVRAKLGLGLEQKIVAEGAYKVSKDVPLFIGGRLVQSFDPDLAGTLGGLSFAYGW